MHAAAWATRHSVVTPDLANAAKLGDTEWCRVLLDAGADVHDSYDETLRLADGYGHTETVKLLIERGADASAFD